MLPPWRHSLIPKPSMTTHYLLNKLPSIQAWPLTPYPICSNPWEYTWDKRNTPNSDQGHNLMTSSIPNSDHIYKGLHVYTWTLNTRVYLLRVTCTWASSPNEAQYETSRKRLQAQLTLNTQMAQNCPLAFFFFYGHTHGTWKFPGQGSNLSYSFDLCCSCCNTGFLTHHTTAGTLSLAFIHWFKH